MIATRATYDVDDVVIHPLRTDCLVQILEEPEDSGGIVLPKSFRSQDEGRSMQGILMAISPGAMDVEPELVPGLHVLIDDYQATWWKGGILPNYLGAVVDEGSEYVLVPAEQVLCEVTDAGE